MLMRYVPCSEDYKANLLAALRRNSAYAVEYLTAAQADSSEAFLVALRDVAEAYNVGTKEPK
jgi:hypothetical protein